MGSWRLVGCSPIPDIADKLLCTDTDLLKSWKAATVARLAAREAGKAEPLKAGLSSTTPGDSDVPVIASNSWEVLLLFIVSSARDLDASLRRLKMDSPNTDDRLGGPSLELTGWSPKLNWTELRLALFCAVDLLSMLDSLLDIAAPGPRGFSSSLTDLRYCSWRCCNLGNADFLLMLPSLPSGWLVCRWGKIEKRRETSSSWEDVMDRGSEDGNMDPRLGSSMLSS